MNPKWQKWTVAGLAAAGCLTLLYASRSIPQLRIQHASLATVRAVHLLTPQAASQIERLQSESQHSAIKELRNAYLDIDLSRPAPETLERLRLLAVGLNSNDDVLRRKSADYARSLLIQVVHGKVQVDAANAPALAGLFVVYKQKASDYVQQTRAAFPASRTLALLNQIRE